MDYIVVRHRRSSEPPPAARDIFIDATLVVNAESDAAALQAVGEKRPDDRAKSWDIVPVVKLDAAGLRCDWCVKPMDNGPQAYGPDGKTVMHPHCAEEAHK